MEEYFRLYTIESITVVELHQDRLDLFRTPELSRQVEAHLKSADCKNVIFDLSELNHIDSSGFGFMVSVRNMIHRRGGNVVLVTGKESILHLISIMNIQLLIPVFQTIADAVQEFSPKPVP